MPAMTVENKRTRRQEGQIVRIDLKNGTHAFARILKRPLFAFYDRAFHDNEIEPSPHEIVSLPIAFKVFVMDYAINNGNWRVYDCIPLTLDLETPPRFFKQDIISGKLAIYETVPQLAPHYERTAAFEECLGLERAAVWGPEHVEDRLRDHFSGQPCKWVEGPKTQEEFEEWRLMMARKREAHANKK